MVNPFITESMCTQQWAHYVKQTWDQVKLETKKKIRESVIQMYKDHPEYKTRIGNQHRGMKLPTIWKPVIQMDMNGNFIKEWPSITAATKSFGLKYSHISNVCSGKRQSTLGYKWKYKI